MNRTAARTTALAVALVAFAAGGCSEGGIGNDDATKAIQAIDPNVVACVPAWQEFAKTLDPKMADPTTGEMRRTTDVYRGVAAARDRWNCSLSRPRNRHRHWCYAGAETGSPENLSYSGWPTDELYSGEPSC
jgi:hypothetical protein